MADQVGHDGAKLMKKRQLRDGITARNSFLSVNYKEIVQKVLIVKLKIYVLVS